MTPASPEHVLTVSLTPALIVEDDPVMQLRLRHVLATAGCDGEHIAVAESVAQARQLLGERRFGIALVDIGLPDGSGVELIGGLQADHPDVSAVVISAFRSEEVILAALRAGAIGYLLKERDDAELAQALRSIAQGGAPIDPAIAKRILALLTQPADAASTPASLPPSASRGAQAGEPHPPSATALSPRERKILTLVAQGLSNREMAEMLAISKLTVECHTKNIYRKLAVNSRTGAVHRARMQGLLR